MNRRSSLRFWFPESCLFQAKLREIRERHPGANISCDLTDSRVTFRNACTNTWLGEFAKLEAKDYHCSNPSVTVIVNDRDETRRP